MTAIKKYVTSKGETRWRVRYRTPNRSYTDKRGFTTKRDAIEFATSLDTAPLSGTYVAPSAGRITLGALYALWAADRTRVKSPPWPSPPRPGPRMWTSMVADIGGGSQDLRGPVVVADLVRAGAGAATIENALGLLRALTDMAVIDRRIPLSPLVGIKPPRRRHQSRGYLTHDQVDALATAIRTQVIHRRGGSVVSADRPDHETVVLLLAYTGLRWGEMAALRVGAVNLVRRRLDVYEAVAEVSGRQVLDSVKNHERRSVPFPDFLAAPLSALMAGKGAYRLRLRRRDR